MALSILFNFTIENAQSLNFESHCLLWVRSEKIYDLIEQIDTLAPLFGPLERRKIFNTLFFSWFWERPDWDRVDDATIMGQALLQPQIKIIDYISVIVVQ